jgi:hypothetical protein
MNLPAIFDVDLPGVGVGDDGEGLLREIDGSTASRRAEVHDRDGDAPAGAGVGHALVGGARAPDLIALATGGASSPENVASRRDHGAIVMEPVALGRCMHL